MGEVRDSLAEIIGRYRTHKEDRGDENEVLHDVFSGNYDERTETVYCLVDDILAEMSLDTVELTARAEEAERFANLTADEIDRLRQVVLAEREACAVLADAWTGTKWAAFDMASGTFPKQSQPGVGLAAAIRARSEEDSANDH